MMTAGDGAGYAQRWGDLESKFYGFLARHDSIGEAAQKHIFAGYAEQFVAGEKVLDVGSGLGDFLDLLKDRGAIGFGVDVDEGMVRESQARGHTIIVSDALTFLTKTPRRFDGLFMGNFVEHFSSEDALNLIRGAHRVLRPGGKLVVATPDPRSLHVHLHEFWRDATHVRLYDRDLLAFMMEVSGFDVVTSGSNEATAYDPGMEWFGTVFADQLTALNGRSGPSRDHATASGDRDDPTAERSVSRPATSPGVIPANRDDTIHVTDVQPRQVGPRAEAASQYGRGRAPLDVRPSHADSDMPDVSDPDGFAANVARHATPVPVIGERRSAAALRRWRGDERAPRHPVMPPPYWGSIAPADNGTATGAALALLRDVLDETRICAAGLEQHESAIARLEARLNGMGAIIQALEQEMTGNGRVIRQRLHDHGRNLADLRRGMEDVHDAHTEEVRLLNEALVQLASESQARLAMTQAIQQQFASESQARLAMIDAIRMQLASLLSHLYPPREYYVVAIRKAEDHGRGGMSR
jgi:SAM-dependent methyltransferase